MLRTLACAAGVCVGAAHAAPPAAATPVTAATTAVASAPATTSAPAKVAPSAAPNAPATVDSAPASAPAPAAADTLPSAPAGAVTGVPGAPAATAPAATTPPAATLYAPPSIGSSAGNLVQTILALCLVLLLLGGFAWFLKRYGPKHVGGSAQLRLVGALNLGGRERILVVEVADQWIVVGASPGRVNALATMPRREGAPSAQLSEHQPSAASFAEWLKQTIDKRNAK